MKKITYCLMLFSFLFCMQIEAQITTFPYLEDFEAGDGGWTVVDDGANTSWALGAPTGVIINSAASGTNAWVTNLSGTYNTNDNSSVVSPEFDLSTLTAPEIQFNLWWDVETSWDGLVLQSSIDNGVTWVNVGNLNDPNNWFNDDTIGGNPGGQEIGWTGTGAAGSGTWVVSRHTLDGLAGQPSVLLRFAFGSDVSVVDEGVAFDDINIYEVTCPEPTNLALINTATTSANIMWDAGGTEPGWEVVVQIAGTGVPTTNGTDTTNNTSYLADNLMPSTDYEAYVRSECGNDFSVWIGPLNFTTECTVFIAPYTEGFENGGTIPNCWSMTGNEDWFFANTGAGEHIGNNGLITGATASGGFFAFCDSSADEGPRELLSPLVDVSTLVNPALSFFEISDNEGNSNSTLEVEVWDGAAWNLMDTYNTNTNGWEFKLIDLSTLTFTGDAQVRFTFFETNTGDFYDDIAIDDVTLDELPSCFVPSNVAVTNIEGTSANLSWLPGSNEQNWQYVIQPVGTGEPATGTDIATTSINFTDLDYDTTYEVYVRADCDADGYSEWVGPITFTTTIQLNFIVDCAVGPTNHVTCYDDGGAANPQIFTFTSSDGTGLNMVINSGQVENNWDEFIVYDSDGVTELYNGYGNAGDLTGITIPPSSGDTISYYVNSDFGGSCQSSGYTPLDITIFCSTCINPTVNYTVVDDCDTGNFVIEIEVTDLGDASPLTITNDVNAETITVTNTGTYQMGPFDYTDTVNLTITTQDSNCELNTLFATGCEIFCLEALPICAGDIPYPSVVGDQEAPGHLDYGCLGSQPDPQWNTIIFDEAGDYQFSLDQIDDFGNPTDIDFIVWGPFPDQDAGCVALLPENIADCSYSPTEFETITLNGVQAGDLFVILITNYEEVSGTYTFTQDSGPTDGTNCDVVCDVSIEYQGTILEEDVDNMGYTTSIDLCGFTSIDLSVNSAYADSFEWYLDGIFFSTDENVTVTDSGNYQVIAYGGVCEDVSYSLFVPVNFYDEAVANQANDLEVCDINENGLGDFDLDSQTTTILGTQSDTEFVVTYHETLNDAQTGNAPLASPYTAADGTIIYVRVEDVDAVGSNSGCATTNTTFNLIVNPLPVANQPQDMELCEDGSGAGNFDLSSQDSTVIGTQTNVAVTYHDSQADANTGFNALSSPYNSTGNFQTIYVRVEDLTTACYKTTSFGIYLLENPTLNAADPILSCDNEDDGMGDYDLTVNEATILGTLSGVAVSYYETESDAQDAINAIATPTNYTSSPTTIYVRVENQTTGCYNITAFNLELGIQPSISFSNDEVYQVCPFATEPITVVATANNFTEEEVTINWYQDGVLIGGQDSLELPTVLSAGFYTIEVVYNETGCSAEEEVEVLEYTSCVIPQAFSPNNDNYNDTFDLSNHDVQSLEVFNRYGVKVFSKTDGYTNEWRGQCDDGSDLPVGTYFYVMKYQGNKTKSSWVYLNK